MATGSNRDVTLGVGIETTGEGALADLAKQVDNLARKGGEAAPVYERLAGELRSLATQAGAVEAYQKLSAELERLTGEQTTAAAKVEELRAEFSKVDEAAKKAAAAQAEARAEFRKAQETVQDNRLALEKLRAETDAAGKATAKYTTDVRVSKIAIIEAKEALNEKRKTYRELTEASQLAAAEQAKVNSQLTRAAQANDAISASTRQATNAMLDAGRAAERLGVDTSDLTEAGQRLVNTQQRLVQSANEVAQSAANAAEYIRFWEKAAEQLAAAELQSAQAREKNAALQRDAAAVAEKLIAQTQAQAAAERQLAAEVTKSNEERFQAIALADRMKVWEEAQERIAAAEKRANEERERTTQLLREAQAEAERLIASDRKQAEAQARVAAETTKANEERFKAIALAERMKVWETGLQRIEEAERQAAAQAKELALAAERAGEEMREAFGQTGVRSLAAIAAESNRVTASVDRLEQEFRRGAISADDLARATSSATVRLAALRREAQQIPAVPGAFESLSSSIGTAINRFGALGAAIATVAVAARPILDTVIKLDQLNRTLSTVLGSSSAAAAAIDNLRSVANRSGQDFNALSQDYSKFVAAARQSGIDMAVVNTVFERVALAAGNLGLSSDQSGRALNALAQIASKGVVQMEELRGQLGDALPGALSLLAKGLGITDQQLIKLVESGNLLAQDALPALGNALAELGPKGGQAVEGLLASWERLKGTFQEVTALVAEGALGKALGGVFDGAVFAAQRLSFAVAFVGEMFTTAGQAVAAVAARITGNISDLGAEIGRITKESNDRLGTLATRIGDAGTAGTEAANAISNAWVQTTVVLTEAISAAEKDAVVAGKQAEARKVLADTQAKVLALAGDELAATQASATAAAGYTAALVAQYEADEKIARLRTEQIAQLIASVGGVERLTAAQRKQIETLQQQAASKQADADKTREQAASAKLAAEALDIQAQSAKNNSARVGELRTAMVAANLELARVKQLADQGRASKEQLTEAQTALGRATGLLKDALSDENRQIEFGIKLASARYGLRIAELEAKKAEAEAAARVAAANGDEAEATRQTNIAKQIGIDVARLSAEAKGAETRATIALLEKQLAETKGEDDVSRARREGLQLRIAEERIKLVQAKGSEAVVRALEAETRAIRQRNVAATGTTSGGSGTQTGNGVSSGGTSAGGGSGLSGIRTGAGANTPSSGRSAADIESLQRQGGPIDSSYNFQVRERLARGDKFSPDEIAALQNGLRAALTNQSLGKPGSVTLEGRADDAAWVEVFRRALEKASSGGLGPGQQSTPVGKSPIYQTTINLNGVSRTVNVASQSDQQTLEALLRELAAQGGRTGP